MLFVEVVTVSLAVAQARGRLAKVELLAALLRGLAPDEVPIGVAYLSGELPQGRLGLGWAAVRDLDPTEPAAEPSLALREVDARLSELASLAGPGSAARRRALLGALFARATQAERELLARLLLGGLRQGALEGVMLDAVVRATGLPDLDVRRASMLAGSLRAVATAALTEGAAGLARFALTLFRPVLPMLASPADGVAGAMEELGEAALEPKLDGARVQLHKDGADVRVYTRALNDVTDGVPELVELAATLPARSLILDGEALALRPDDTPEGFQTTMRRFGRRRDVAALRVEVPLAARFFDVLLADGEPLLDAPLRARGEALTRLVPEGARVPRLVTSDAAVAERFFRDALAVGHEGMMAKALDAPYEAGSRGAAWLKVKPVHTLDLVVLAVERGSGRRRGTLSNLHLGARDATSGGFVMLGKTFKGMTDELLAWQTAALAKLATEDDGHVVRVRPELVVEIAFDGVQRSPQYPGGVALRFARVKRYRPDKSAADADTIGTVRDIAERGHRP